MNDELITRLRAFADDPDKEGTVRASLVAEAAAALEAAQARADANAHHCNEAGAVAEHWRAERDAEAALADQLASALTTAENGIDWAGEATFDAIAAALAAHRERRTTPTKDGER